MAAPHIVLLGDSILDNGAYTRGEPDVVTHLRSGMAPGWRATLLAADGSTTAQLPSQFARIPRDTSHLVVAIGGNDALMNSDLLDTPVRSSAETLKLFGGRLEWFEAAYRAAIVPIVASRVPIVLCTIYNGHFEPPRARLVATGLAMFNDVILRVAFELRTGVIDLRGICNKPADYANPIEPSGSGGAKIASAILRAVALQTPSPAAAFVVT